METAKIPAISAEKPKILNTLTSISKDSHLVLLNEYRTKGSESLRPNISKKFERITAKKAPRRSETTEKKSKITANLQEKANKFDQNQARLNKIYRPNFSAAHSMSPNTKITRFLPRFLDKIDEYGPLQKTDFVLKGSKSKASKPLTESKAVNVNKVKENPSQENITYKYAVGLGNNGALVKRIMQTRDYWQEVANDSAIFNFKWNQSNRTYQYEKLNSNSSCKQILNHFEFHKEISSKASLIKNLAFFCDQNKMNLFDITPTTFLIDLTKEDCDTSLQNFINFYHKNTPSEIQKPELQRKLYLDIPKKYRFYYSYNNYEKKTNIFGIYGKPKMFRTFTHGSNYLWLLKPNHFNRGWGIQIFQTLEELERLISDLYEGVDEKIFAHMEKKEEIAEKNEEKDKKNKIKLSTFVIQKYIERPLLVENRKFDIRVWVLITQNYDAFFFREGYLRTSSEPFLLDNSSKNNHFIHLTNNAIQKYGKNYGQFEDGNQLSFANFENYLKENKVNVDFKTQILPKIKEDIFLSLNAVKRRLNQEDRKYCFEIFGYDFIIDEDFHVWLIEVNTNPCIEESSPLLQMLIPRMLNDAFKLTVDAIFPKIIRKKENSEINPIKTEETNPITENIVDVEEDKAAKTENSPSLRMQKTKEIPSEKDNKFSVDGYDDTENLWEFLGSIRLHKGASFRFNDKKS